jgi:NAD+ kinase
VVPDSSTIELEVHTRGLEVLASIDNKSFIVRDGARFRIKRSEYHTFLAQTQNISFYDTLKDRVMWGVDKRDVKPEKF